MGFRDVECAECGALYRVSTLSKYVLITLFLAALFSPALALSRCEKWVVLSATALSVMIYAAISMRAIRLGRVEQHSIDGYERANTIALILLMYALGVALIVHLLK